MKPKRLIIKKKPIKPVREEIEEKFDLDVGDELSSVLAWAKSLGVEPSKVTFTEEHYYESHRAQFKCTVLESEEEYNKRLDNYKKELLSYEQWYEENKNLIEEHIKKKTEEANRKYQKQIEKIKKLIVR